VTVFTGRVLKRLDSIWRFVGGVQGLSDMNLEGSVQPVEDLSRQAELGSGLGASDGYFMRGYSFSHPGAGTIRNTLDPWTSVDAFEPQRVKASVWLMGCWAQHNNNNVDRGGISLTMPAAILAPGLTSGNELLLAYYTGEVPTGVADVGIFPMVATIPGAVTVGQGNMGLFARLPMSLPNGCTLNFMGHASAGGVISLTCLLWMGAAGARAPGVA